MRKFIKFILILAVLAGVAMYYRLFDFSHGFAMGSDEAGITDVAHAQKVYVLKLSGGNNYIAIENKNNIFIGVGNESDVEIIKTSMALLGKEIVKLSWGVAIVGVVVILIIMFFPKRKESYNKS